MTQKSKFFVPPGHFYSPIPDPDEVREHLVRVERRRAPAGISIDADAMQRVFERLAPAMGRMPFSDERVPEFRYYYNNNQFTYGDASILFGMIDTLRPSRIIEIGSGHSSALTLDACAHFDLSTHLTFIEPYPTRLHALLRDRDLDAVTLLESKVQSVDPALFDALCEDDILIIDSSHVAKTGSDVCFELFDILPRLAPGVRVLIHDIFDGFEYPRAWLLDDQRAWNEIYFLRAFLMYNARVEVSFFNDWFANHRRDVVASTPGPFGKNPGGSLWLTMRGEPDRAS